MMKKGARIITGNKKMELSLAPATPEGRNSSDELSKSHITNWRARALCMCGGNGILLLVYIRQSLSSDHQKKKMTAGS